MPSGADNHDIAKRIRAAASAFAGGDEAPAPANAVDSRLLLAEVTRLKGEVQRYQQLAEEGARAKEAAEAANRAKTEFLSMMSHELRTPLNAILGFSEIMRSEALGELGAPEYREFSADIYASGSHLLALINDLLDLAKVESGMVELKEDLLDLASLANDVMRIVGRTEFARGVNLVLEQDAVAPHFKGDKRKFNQILINLISNAVKFTAEGKTVAVRIKTGADGGIIVEVADQGVGIPAKDLQRVMEPFFQVDSALNRSHPGTGLGLPLCRQLVELHGGTLELESVVGQGTTARMKMPAERTRPAKSQAA